MRLKQPAKQEHFPLANFQELSLKDFIMATVQENSLRQFDRLAVHKESFYKMATA